MGLELRLYLVALAALTRWRLPRWVGCQPDWPQRSLRHFAGVGLLVGAGQALVVWTAGHLWPALVSVLCGMVFSLWLTAARHEKGWSLWCDGQAPGASALGAAGAVGLVLLLALKAAALHGLVVRDLAALLALLPLAHVWSRAGMVLLVWGRPAAHVRTDDAPPRDGLVPVVTVLWCALVTAAAAAFVPASALAAAAGAAVVVVLLVRQVPNQHPAPHAGAGQDAAQQGVELAVYLAVLGQLAQG